MFQVLLIPSENIVPYKVIILGIVKIVFVDIDFLIEISLEDQWPFGNI